jgi:hypothetical protein
MFPANDASAGRARDRPFMGRFVAGATGDPYRADTLLPPKFGEACLHFTFRQAVRRAGRRDEFP